MAIGVERLEIGRVLVRAFENVARWPGRFIALAVAYGLICGAIDVNLGSRSFALDGLIGFFIEVAATQLALKSALVGFDGGAQYGRAFGLSFLTNLGILVGVLLLIVPGIMLYVRWALALPAMMRENIDITDALGRSNALTEGNRWRIFGLALLLILPPLLLGGLMGFLSGVFMGPSAPDTFGMAAFANLLSALFILFAAACWVEVYAALSGAQDSSDRLAEVFA